MDEQLNGSLKCALEDEAATTAFGSTLARHINKGGVVYLRGDLGAGKTTLCRGVLRELGYQGAVKSPTFTLVEPYSCQGGQVYHFDLYRLNDPDELEYIGIDEYFADQSLCLIEWPEKADGTLPDCDLDIELLLEGRSRRVIISSKSEYGDTILKRLRLEWVNEP